jgi:hypothetical protein
MSIYLYDTDESYKNYLGEILSYIDNTDNTDYILPKSEYNTTGFTTYIINNFIENFITDDNSSAHLTGIYEILLKYRVFFGSNYIKQLYTNYRVEQSSSGILCRLMGMQQSRPQGCTNPQPEIYIDYHLIVNFLLEISNYSSRYVLNKNIINDLKVSLNLESSYNTPDNQDAVFELEYNGTNRKIKIYIVNDTKILQKLTNNRIDPNIIWYSAYTNKCYYMNANLPEMGLLEPSHLLGIKHTTEDKLFKDVLLQLITYIPEYISIRAGKFNILTTNPSNQIYNHPALWFHFLISIADIYTINNLNIVYVKLMGLTINSSNINSIITKIYIDKLLNKYNINLFIEQQPDETKIIKFIRNDLLLENNEKENIRLLLLFYFTYKIYELPLETAAVYKYPFTIDTNFPNILSTIEIDNEDYIPPAIKGQDAFIQSKKSIYDKIQYLYTIGYKCSDVIQSEEYSEAQTIELLSDKNNIILIEKNNTDSTKRMHIFNKQDLEKFFFNDENWIVDCDLIRNQTKLANFDYYSDICIKLHFITGAQSYIRANSVYTILNSLTQLYYIELDHPIVTSTSYEKFIDYIKFNNYAADFCSPSASANINNRYKITRVPIDTKSIERCSILIKSLKSPNPGFEDILNSDIVINSNVEETGTLSKRRKVRGGKNKKAK